MIAPFRFLAWLVLPALMSCSFNLLAATAEGAPQALHLLDYIGADYPPTVEAGKVIDDSEYREQVEFLGVLQGLVADLPEKPERAELIKGVDELLAAVTAHQDGAVVAHQARQLGANVGMTPPPANLRDAARLDRLSLYAIYNTLGLGVEGTDMPSFADQLDDRQRWDLATYIAGFTADPAAANSEKSFNLADLARQTPNEVLAAEGPGAVATFRAQRAQPPQVKRGPAQLLDYTAATLDKSLAAFRNGEHEQAYDLSVAAYLEGFELVESSLDNVDANVRKDTEKALMAYRQSLQDGLPIEQVQQRLDVAKGKLTESAGLLGSDGLSWSLSYISGLLILLREGLEAILVLAAILAFLRNTGQQSAVRSVNRELLEGCTALFASVMVLWLGVWMHDRRHAAAWQDYIKSSLVGGGGRFGFAMLAFFSVYRELFEVILFYETLWLQAGPAGHNAVLAGGATALVLLVGLAW
eukprot:gene18049-21542_t